MVYYTKSCFGVVHNIELGWEGETEFVLSMFNNFVILAGMVSRVLSKIVATMQYECQPSLSVVYCSILQYIAATSRQYGYQPTLSVVYYSILQTGPADSRIVGWYPYCRLVPAMYCSILQYTTYRLG